MKYYMHCHIIAFLTGFLLDLILGDPYWLPHPVRLIGKLIAGAEKVLRAEVGEEDNEVKNNQEEFRKGIGLVLFVIGSVSAVASFLVFMAYRLHPIWGMALESIMTYQILAVKCLKVESMKVYHCLKKGSLEQARTAVSMIVGRDTQYLDEEGVCKAAIETVAENASDGVIAPMLYLAVGGPILGFVYKAINTMDSMVGYKNDRYLYFGRAAAKLDDVVNFIPARISLSDDCSFFSWQSFLWKGAMTIYKRDRLKHASPNSGQTEAVCAGALSIRLAGDASYFGKIVKPYIGEAVRKIEYEDIKRANHLMYLTAWLGETVCLLVMLATAF